MEKTPKETGLRVFDSAENFELAQRVAKSLSASNLVPVAYRNDISNTLIALEIANRIGASPLMVMQHLYIVNGSPSWSSTFLISAINTSGRFEPLRFKISGKGENLSCIAWTKDKNGELLESPEVTMQMAKLEGWVQKKGSKWQTMPELMIRYRAAAFFSRLHCPEITMGMQTTEEVIDTVYQEIKQDPVKTPAPNPHGENNEDPENQNQEPEKKGLFNFKR